MITIDERECSYHEAFLNGKAVFIRYTQETVEPGKLSQAEPVVFFSIKYDRYFIRHIIRSGDRTDKQHIFGAGPSIAAKRSQFVKKIIGIYYRFRGKHPFASYFSPAEHG